nr:hypothetical protein [Candidatus Sigynarchaeum springense]MDO8117134.1 hypothetical protein [Candidatus Sigynarchaeota archaeon]
MSSNIDGLKKQEKNSTLGEMLTFIKETKDGKYTPMENVNLQENREENLDLSECFDDECSYYYGIY